MKKLRVAVGQINSLVGNIPENKLKIIAEIKKAAEKAADILALPELCLTGYPPEDLVFKPDFIDDNLKALSEIAAETKGLGLMVVLGFINRADSITNSAAVIFDGEVVDVYDKIFLPNYGVFDEKRYFREGTRIPVYRFKDTLIGVNICEDLWHPLGPAHAQTAYGNAEILININASPFHHQKQVFREKMYTARSADETAFLVTVNAVGGQDELIFDGNSTAYDFNGDLISRLPAFEEASAVYDLNLDGVFRTRLKDIRRHEYENDSVGAPKIDIVEVGNLPKNDGKIEERPSVTPILDDNEAVYKALVLGTKDYVNKNGFKTVIIAISGGIDSALVAAIAVEALGAERVKGIYLPTKFSADISGTDAKKLCDNLGIGLLNLPIQETFEGYLKLLEPVFQNLPFGVAEENLQSRIRGNIVMGISNKFGWMVLTTGNKSEMSTGYATLYGDMAGGFAVIKDVLKTQVFAISKWINREREIIPERIITRPPSAELRPDQKDTDSLPPYEILDPVIRAYVEEDLSFEEIAELAGGEQQASDLIRLIDRNEYKRRQAPPGIKISKRAFGRDRRMPITNGYR